MGTFKLSQNNLGITSRDKGCIEPCSSSSSSSCSYRFKLNFKLKLGTDTCTLPSVHTKNVQGELT